MLNNDVTNMLDQLQQDRFYGSLEIKFENGKAVLLRKTETILPNRENRGQNELRSQHNYNSKH